MARRRPATVHGSVIVDKPPGPTSHDVVALLRRRFGERRIGHAGTLDPTATGLLVVGIGSATRLLRFATAGRKSYECEIVFGIETSTLDAAGETTATWCMDLDPAEVADAAAGFVGAISQLPPMVSAVRVGGRRLHEIARSGEAAERVPRQVEVYRFDVEPTGDPQVYRASVDCSAGTYVRTLGADLGSGLGGGAHIRALRRTRSGSFSLAEAELPEQAASWFVTWSGSVCPKTTPPMPAKALTWPLIATTAPARGRSSTPTVGSSRRMSASTVA